MKSKILKIAGITLLALVCFAWTTPYLFKEKITRLVKARIGKDLRAHVYFADLDISLFRHFPKISIALDSLQVTCVGEFQGDTLMTANRFDIACEIPSLITGDSIRISSVTVNQPRFHAHIHKDGHANWNILQPEVYPNIVADSPGRALDWNLRHYAVHNGYLDYQDEKRDMHLAVFNLEHAGSGHFGSGLFSLKTRTSADAVQVDFNGAVPCQFTVKTSINMTFRVDNKTHTYSFNTDQVSLNDLKLHTEGFFQWINDSSYNMNFKFKVPSTKFKDLLSILPSVYQKDFASIETSGVANFNGFVKGKYDEKHAPAYHANLFITNGYFKYPDRPVPAENINFGLQADNPDGVADHLTINVSGGHAEINHDTLDMHLLLKNLQTKPFIDFAFVGKLDLSNISKMIKTDTATRLNGFLTTDIHARGSLSANDKQKKNLFQASGDFSLTNFLWASKVYRGGITVNELLLAFNPKQVQIKTLKGEYLSTHIDATGSLNNLFDFALTDQPLQATIDLKADELNLRDWIRTGQEGPVASSDRAYRPFQVPRNIDFTIHAEAGKLHYDNLDLQNLAGTLVITDQTIQMHQLTANGLDGDIIIDGSYSTWESSAEPEIALTYDVKKLDIQKTFLAFNTIRKIMPVARFMAGTCNARMTLKGRLQDDMTPDPQTLEGTGRVELVAGTLKDFGPLDKLSQSLDIAELRDIPLADVTANFSFKSGKVAVSAFPVSTGDIDMVIAGTHGFDQSLDYDINLKLPRSGLGSKGIMFVKNVVNQAAEKGIPVQLSDAVDLNVRMNGTLNTPEVKADMDAVVDNAATGLKKEINDFVNAKLDSAKQQLRKPPASSQKHLSGHRTGKSGTHSKAKKHAPPARKKKVHPKAKKKKKKPAIHYTTTLNKEQRTVSSNKKP